MTRSARRDFRVVIFDDHALFAESLELALSLQGYDARRLEVPESTPPAQLLTSLLSLRPHLLLLDLDLGCWGDATWLVRPLVERSVQVVIVTASDDRARWGQCLFHGARTVLDKTQALGEIQTTVRRIHHGLPVLGHEERERLVRAWREDARLQHDVRIRMETLSHREREILGLLMRGCTVRDIARQDVVSEATVRTQVKSILAKLAVSSQLAAVSVAHQVDWTPPHS